MKATISASNKDFITVIRRCMPLTDEQQKDLLNDLRNYLPKDAADLLFDALIECKQIRLISSSLTLIGEKLTPQIIHTVRIGDSLIKLDARQRAIENWLDNLSQTSYGFCISYDWEVR